MKLTLFILIAIALVAYLVLVFKDFNSPNPPY